MINWLHLHRPIYTQLRTCVARGSLVAALALTLVRADTVAVETALLTNWGGTRRVPTPAFTAVVHLGGDFFGDLFVRDSVGEGEIKKFLVERRIINTVLLQLKLGLLEKKKLWTYINNLFFFNYYKINL